MIISNYTVSSERIASPALVLCKSSATTSRAPCDLHCNHRQSRLSEHYLRRYLVCSILPWDLAFLALADTGSDLIVRWHGHQSVPLLKTPRRVWDPASELSSPNQKNISDSVCINYKIKKLILTNVNHPTKNICQFLTSQLCQNRAIFLSTCVYTADWMTPTRIIIKKALKSLKLQ